MNADNGTSIIVLPSPDIHGSVPLALKEVAQILKLQKGEIPICLVPAGKQ